MRHQASVLRKARTANADREARLVKQLWWWLVAALLVAALTGALLWWGAWFSPNAERRVKVYSTHECVCVASWIESLEKKGFEVASYEYDTLRFVRTKLHVPANLNGCHVGEYLGYFLEGHVAAGAVHPLAVRRPQADGLVTEASLTLEVEHLSTIEDHDSPVMLVTGAQVSPWFDPSSAAYPQ